MYGVRYPVRPTPSIYRIHLSAYVLLELYRIDLQSRSIVLHLQTAVNLCLFQWLRIHPLHRIHFM